MPRFTINTSWFILMLVFTNQSFSQSLDLSEFELKAHYELSSDGADLTSNYDSIALDTPIFEFEGIFSRGCYVLNPIFGDSCFIQTPSLNSLNESTFVIQLDYRPTEFHGPIFNVSTSTRHLGMETSADGRLILLTNNATTDTLQNFQLELDTWYNTTVIHNTLDSNTYVYHNEELIFTKKAPLNFAGNANDISNSNFGTGRAFEGYWKDLKVYTSTPLISENHESNSPSNSFVVYPNPAKEVLNIDMPLISDLKYSIFDINGQLIQNSALKEKSINISNLNSGFYTLIIYENSELFSSTTFIKT